MKEIALRLRDMETFFEGIVPSIIATSSANGIPNVSYLSHVVLVDGERVGLSNQFFNTTMANLAENPKAAILLVDGARGGQCRLRAVYEKTVFDGPLFNRVSTQLDATSAQVGMTGIMRLRGVDIFRVVDITIYPSPVAAPIEPVAREPLLEATASLAMTLAHLPAHIDTALDATLEWMRDTLGCDQTVVFLADENSGQLATAGSLGYERSGVGSEIAFGDGVFGSAARERDIVKISDLSRARRYSAAVKASAENENLTRTIAPPMDAETMSQIAVPMISGGHLIGVLGAESRRRLAFTAVQEAALTLAAQHLAGVIALSQALPEDQKPAPSGQPPGKNTHRIEIRYYAFDDSIFIADEYIIKGIAGRLLNHMLRAHVESGRTGFTNRELRLSTSLRLPEFKDNLETRLLLLRRRLADKISPIQLVPTGRGQFSLTFDGQPVFVEETTLDGD
ncbi:GAF domain-containing protein [Rhizobium sp. S163]|uniref:GAF domain-containing protein n=1 Tax=Rhizobium sp. S163 TaxID=3055039 RepID=UPI0025A99685|nr:GAF domain-containing protein [Rhizobium sp. S163]MDM9645021.1 GAF domain-containing protein [Rhizobium sp. S163]